MQGFSGATVHDVSQDDDGRELIAYVCLISPLTQARRSFGSIASSSNHDTL
jgi:hypothetical protein